MAVAAEALLRLKAVLDDEGFRKAQAALKDLDGQASRAGGTINSRVNRPLGRMDRTLDNINDSRAMRNVDRGLVTTGAGIAGAVKLAIDFEKEFSGMRKQLGLDIKSPMLDTYRRQLLDLSTKTPTGVATLARIGTEGAKIGLRGKELLDYVNQVQKASKAMEIPAEELVGNFNGINAALQQSPRQGYKLLDVINRIDDDLSGKVDSRQILEGMSRVGSFPKLAGVKPQDTAAMLSTIIAQNKSPEIAATGLKNFLLPLAGGSQVLSKEKRNTLARLYGFDDPGLKYLTDQKQAIEKEIKQIESGVDKRGLKIGLSQLDKKALTKDVDQAITTAQASGNKQLVKQLKQQRKAILDGANDGLVTDKRQQLLDRSRLKELKDQLTSINKQIKGRPGAEAFGSSIANDLAKRMQIDSRGTILDFIERIKQLPKEQQLGFVTEFFGKDSSAEIMALVENTKLLSSAFNLVDQEMGKTKGQIGSVQREYDTLLQGAPAQLEIFRNALMAPAIEIGRTLLPALVELTRALKPVIDQFTAFVRANPQAVQNFVKLAAAVAGLRVALWALGGVVATLRGLGAVLRAIGGAGAFLGGLARTIAGTLGAVGPLLARLKGMFAGLGGLGKGVGGALSTVLRTGAAGGAGLFSGVLNAAKALPGMLMNALRGMGGFGAGLVRLMGLDRAALGLRTFIDTLRGFTPTMIMRGGEWVTPWTARLATALRGILPVLALVGRTLLGVFTGPVGWVTLLVAAGVALYAFRDKIGQFVEWVKPKLASAFAPLLGLNQQKATPGGKQPAQQSFNPIAALNPAALGASLGNAIAGPISSIGEKLPPHFARISTLFTSYVVNPIRAAWNFLVVYIGQTIAAYAIVWWQGISTNFQTNVVMPIQTMWTNFVTWIGTTVAGIQGRLSGIWVGISTLFNQHVSTPISQWWNWLVGIITNGAANLRSILAGWWAGISVRFQNEVVTPIQQLWTNFTGWLTERTAGVRNGIGGMWNGLAQRFQEHIVTPIQNLWNRLVEGMQSKWRDTVNFFQNAWNYVATGINERVITPIRNLFTRLADNIRSVFDNLLGWARNLGNSIIDRVNPVRQAAGFQPLQRFAKGGYVKGPTLAWVGEGKDSEYIIPARKMAAASQRYLAGARGASVLQGGGIPGFAKGGFVKGGGNDNSKPKGLYGEPLERFKDIVIQRYDPKREGPAGQYRFDSNGDLIPMLMIYNEKFPQLGTQLVQESLWEKLRNKIMQTLETNERLRQIQIKQFKTMGYSQAFAEYNAGVPMPQVIGKGGEIPAQRTLSRRRKGLQKVFKTPTWANRSLNQRTNTIWDSMQQRSIQSANDMARKRMGMYASGGFVTRPTLGLIGEGRDSEYIIPSSRMAASSMAYLSGARGMGVVNPPRFANGGVVGPTRNRSANLDALMERSGGIGSTAVIVEAPTINATIQVQTGDVIDFQGEQYVSIADFQRGMRSVQDQTMALLRTSQGRRATGR